MVWLIDDLAEAALGPWGIAVAVGVGLASVARRRAGQATETAATAAPVTLISESPTSAGAAVAATAAAATSVLAPLTAAGGVVGRVKDGVQQRMAEATEYWHDLYAEAHHEWEQARIGATVALIPSTEAVVGAAAPATLSAVELGEAATDVKPASKRVRGPNGRYVKDSP